VDESILDPSKAWETPSRWHVAATDLAIKFINNFSKFTANVETAKLAEHGPVI
jgi:phosphoenolpyruvate carboxykinase (ATP)